MLILIACSLIVMMVLTIICLLWTSIYIEVSFIFDHNEQQAIVRIRWMSFCMMRRRFNLKEESNLVQKLGELIESNRLQDVKTTITHIQRKISDWWSLTKHMQKKLTIRHLQWLTYAGTGEGLSTGILCGLIWSVIGTVQGGLQAYGKFACRPEVSCTPVFQAPVFATKMDCMLSIQTAQAILAAFQWRSWIKKYVHSPESK